MNMQKLPSFAGSVRGFMTLMLAGFLTSVASAANTTNLVLTTQPVSTTVGAPLTNVVVQIQDSRGNNILQGGTAIALALTKGSGLTGVTNVNTDASGKAVFSNLAILQAGNGDTLQASGKILKAVTSSVFNITQGKTTNVLSASTNAIVYGQSVTLTSTISVIAPASGPLAGTVTFKDGSVVIGTSALSAAAQASFTTTNRFTAGTHNLTAVFSGSTNFSASTSTAFSLTVSKLALTVSGITASNKVYDAKTTAGLNLAGASLTGVLGTDTVVLVKTNAKGLFPTKITGRSKVVTISGLTITGTDAANYTLVQPTATAAIMPANLTVTAKGVNKSYDGTTAATVTVSDNHLAGDVVTDSYASAAFTNSSVGTVKPVTVSGITISGTDSTNYSVLNTSAVTTANITAVSLLVTANSLSRPFGATNPPLTYYFTGLVGSDTATTGTTGSPALTTTAKTNSVTGSYPITIAKGTLAAANYTLAFSNGVLTVNPAGTAALLTSSLNPARTNQNITFMTKISALAPGVPAPTGLVRFKSNGTNTIGSPVNLTNGTTTLVIPAAMLGSGSVMVTAEFADPSGNFNASTNSASQAVVVVAPSIGKVSMAPPKGDGTIQATLSGTPGQTFILEASGDLIHWTPIYTNVADTNGFISIVESNSLAYPSRYYRGMMP